MKKLDKDLLEHTLRERARGYIRDHVAGGVVMLVNQCGERVAAVCEGLQDPETGAPVTENTFFRLASMTKPVTGAAALIAMEKGYFGLDDLVSDHFPEYADRPVGHVEDGHIVIDGPVKTPLRMFHLLTHSSGVIAQEETGLFQIRRYPASAFESLETIVDYTAKNGVLSFEPMSHVCYSAYFAFDTVARLIERKSGMSYAEFLDKFLFSPVGIRDITFHPSEEQWSRMSAMYDITDCWNRMVTVNMGRECIFEGFPVSYTCAGAGIAGTPEAYSRFAELLCHRGTLDGVRVFGEEYADLLSRPYVPTGTPGLCETESWGLGVRVVTSDKTHLPKGSFGWSGAYGTHFWVDPENEITAVFMKNNRWYDAHGCGESGVRFERDVMESVR